MAFNWGSSGMNTAYGQWQNQSNQGVIQGQQQQYGQGQGQMNRPNMGYNQTLNMGFQSGQYITGPQQQGFPHQQNVLPQQINQQYFGGNMQTSMAHYQQHRGNHPNQFAMHHPQDQHGQQVQQQFHQQQVQHHQNLQQQQQQQQSQRKQMEDAARFQEEARKHQFEEQQKRLKEMSLIGSRSRSGSGKNLIDDMLNKANMSLTNSQSNTVAQRSHRPTSIFGKPLSTVGSQDEFSGFQTTATNTNFSAAIPTQQPPPGGYLANYNPANQQTPPQTIPGGLGFNSMHAPEKSNVMENGLIQQSPSDDFGDFQSGGVQPSSPTDLGKLDAFSMTGSARSMENRPPQTSVDMTFQTKSNSSIMTPDVGMEFFHQTPGMPPQFQTTPDFRSRVNSFGTLSNAMYPGTNPDVLSQGTPLPNISQGVITNQRQISPQHTQTSQGPSLDQAEMAPPPLEEEHKAATDIDIYGSELPEWCYDKLSLPSVYTKVLERSQDKDGYINIHKLQPILLASGLGKEKLAEVWEMANKKNPGTLVEEELFLVLALMALAQAGWNKLSIKKVASCRAPPIPELPDYIFMPKGEESVFGQEPKSVSPEQDSVSSLPLDPNDRYSVFRVLDRQRSESLDDPSVAPERRFSMLSTGSNDSYPTPSVVLSNHVQGTGDQESDDWGTFATFSSTPPGSVVSSGMTSGSHASLQPTLVESSMSLNMTSQQSTDIPPQFTFVNRVQYSGNNVPLVPTNASIIRQEPTQNPELKDNVLEGTDLKPSDDFSDFQTIKSNDSTNSIPLSEKSTVTDFPTFSQDSTAAAAADDESWADFTSFEGSNSVGALSTNFQQTFVDSTPTFPHTVPTSSYDAPNDLPPPSGKSGSSELADIHVSLANMALSHPPVSSSGSSSFDSGISKHFDADFGEFAQATTQGNTDNFFANSTSLQQIHEKNLNSFVTTSNATRLTHSFDLVNNDSSDNGNWKSHNPITEAKIPETALETSGKVSVTNSSKYNVFNTMSQGGDEGFASFKSFPASVVNDTQVNGFFGNETALSNTHNETLSNSQGFSTSLDLKDRYRALKVVSQEGEQHAAEWNRCLYAIVQTFSTAVSTIKRHAINEQEKIDILSTSKGKQHFNSLKEIYAVSRRIATSINNSPLSKSDSVLQRLLAQIDELWGEVRKFMSASPSLVLSKSLDLTDTCLSEGDDVGHMCGVCLLSTRKESAGAKQWDLISTHIDYGGKIYHSACANFWCNKVNSVLPALPPISSGLL